jgi:broad specificity phosphatase PhoE
MRFLGRTDLALSEEGRGQAAAIKEAFEELSFDRIVHSGQKRAAETAAILAEGRGVPFEEIEAFREIAFGTWEVRSMKDVAEKEPEAFAARGRDFARFRPPGGENFLDVQQRVWPAFLSLLEREKGDLVITAHAGVFKTIIFTLLDLSWQKLFSLRQDYCGVHVLSRYEEHLTVKQLNWTPRLGG